ncbi:hypothetical protein AMATHDRAFT_150375 [Amanita thiersii Skay4041]|uniref:Vps72/YL1 C-terminal domain-containing protein n=1 Tax=Amanita thiersii Skay4041 TaxID=703135 RepID=A0A2A9NKH4_9AGAR|nr:hypothetical protein AMATHDRAFT_150375 [Amanita thiersii Skay4041]
MSDEEEYLVRRRSRRSTAGNRMQAALAEMSLEDANKDLEDDAEFTNIKEEEDVFESDFESTDEEAAQAEVAAGEKEVQDEERRVKKQTKSRLEKVTAAADARLRVTFDPNAMTEIDASQKPKQKRRVSLGLAVNAETGEVIPADEASVPDGQNMSTGSGVSKVRQSKRKHTIQNTVETVQRMKWSEEKKAAAPKKTKVVKKTFTQGELIARALDNEEGNIVEHRDYLILEEEKRKRARVVKASVEGPLIRWVSRKEEVREIIEPSPPVAAPTSLSIGSTSYLAPSSTSSYYQPTNPPSSTNNGQVQSTNIQPITSVAPKHPPQTHLATTMPIHSTTFPIEQLQLTQTQTPVPVMNLPIPVAPQPQPIEKTVDVTKNYLVHELGQKDGVRKPSWMETMNAMFGDHVKWDEVRIYVGKGRPLSRPIPICPITGKQALYMDPRTGVPYADLRGFRALTEILEHEYVWNAELGCYVGRESPGSASDRDSVADVVMDSDVG